MTMQYSSAQVYRAPPTLAGIFGVGSVIYFKEGELFILPLIALIYGLIIFIVQPLRIIYRNNREFQFVTVTVMTLGLLINYLLKNSNLNFPIAAICIIEASIFAIVVWHYFNPEKLNRLGWHDTDS